MQAWEARYRLEQDDDPAGAAVLFEQVVSRMQPWQPHQLSEIALGYELLSICRHRLGNDKGFQIRHLELRSRGDTGLEALRHDRAGPCESRPTFHMTL